MREEVVTASENMTNPSRYRSRLSSATSKMRESGALILIVESQTYTAKITAHMLKKWGYATEIAHSPTAALKMIQAGEIVPDLIFVEVPNATPDLIDFPNRVRALPLFSNTPIVAHSVRREKAVITTAIRSGYCDYILRPTESELVKDRLDGALSRAFKGPERYFALPVTERATAVVDLRLISLNEFGAQGFSETPLAVDAVVTLNSELFKKMGIVSESLRVTRCDEATRGGKFRINLEFNGLTAEGARKIREYILRNAFRTNSLERA